MEAKENFKYSSFKVLFFFNLFFLLLYVLGLILFLSLRRCPALDIKSWGNITVNLASFSMKMIAWIHMLVIYDPI